jgi:hypothetical protein
MKTILRTSDNLLNQILVLINDDQNLGDTSDLI